MGKPAIKIKCLRCGKEFWVKSKKDKVTGNVIGNTYCQKCRHKQAAAARQPVKRRRKKKDIPVKIVSNAVDYRRDVELLRRIEIYNPRVLDRIRKSNGEKEEETR